MIQVCIPNRMKVEVYKSMSDWLLTHNGYIAEGNPIIDNYGDFHFQQIACIPNEGDVVVFRLKFNI